jgi:hypothetical protein
VQDPTYLTLTDDDVKLYLEVVRTRDFAKYPTLDLLPTECVYPLILLAKKELYFALATSSAPLIDLVADNNNQLKRGQRFEHYYKLIALVDTEYNQYIKDGGAGTHNTLTSYDVLLSNKYYSKRNYELGVVPALFLSVEGLSANTVEIQWEPTVGRFLNYRVYISKTPILDLFADEVVSKDAMLVKTIFDSKKTMCRLEGLEPETEYYILVSVQDKTTLTGYQEIAVMTSEE